MMAHTPNSECKMTMEGAVSASTVNQPGIPITSINPPGSKIKHCQYTFHSNYSSVSMFPIIYVYCVCQLLVAILHSRCYWLGPTLVYLWVIKFK